MNNRMLRSGRKESSRRETVAVSAASKQGGGSKAHIEVNRKQSTRYLYELVQLYFTYTPGRGNHWVEVEYIIQLLTRDMNVWRHAAVAVAVITAHYYMFKS